MASFFQPAFCKCITGWEAKEIVSIWLTSVQSLLLKFLLPSHFCQNTSTQSSVRFLLNEVLSLVIKINICNFITFGKNKLRIWLWHNMLKLSLSLPYSEIEQGSVFSVLFFFLLLFLFLFFVNFAFPVFAIIQSASSTSSLNLAGRWYHSKCRKVKSSKQQEFQTTEQQLETVWTKF